MLSNTTNDTAKSDALTQYIIAITNYTTTTNSTQPLNITVIDAIVSSLNLTYYQTTSSESILIVTRPTNCDNQTVIGALFRDDRSSGIIDSENKNTLDGDDSLLAAGYVDFIKICSNVSRFNILIINNPTVYRNASILSSEQLVSSLIMAKVNYGGTSDIEVAIQLYFQDNVNKEPRDSSEYVCGYFDDTTNKWNSTGCSLPKYDEGLHRYQCECNHFSSFGLIWRPSETPDPNPPELYAEDKASIAFQIFSILCIIGIGIYGVVNMVKNPKTAIQPMHMLPLLSYAFVALLFILYISLTLSVYNRFKNEAVNSQSSNSQNKLNPRADPNNSNNNPSILYCTSNEERLMFAVYFFIIFMLCTKTSIGYDNYRRYVYLCPPPSFRLLIGLLVASLGFSLIFVLVAVGVNSQTENGITQANAKKICWFTKSYMYAFLITPVCILLGINLYILFRVCQYNLRHEKELHEKHKDEGFKTVCRHRRQCAWILIGCTITQGLGWIFGVLIVIATAADNAIAGTVFSWFFIIINGSEGVFAILLYYLISKKSILLDRLHDKNDRDTIDYYTDGGRFIDMNEMRDNDDRDMVPLDAVASDSPRSSVHDLRDVTLSFRVSRTNLDT